MRLPAALSSGWRTATSFRPTLVYPHPGSCSTPHCNEHLASSVSSRSTQVIPRGCCAISARRGGLLGRVENHVGKRRPTLHEQRGRALRRDSGNRRVELGNSADGGVVDGENDVVSADSSSQSATAC